MPRKKTISSEKILDAARKLFIMNGYNVPTSDIAEEAGVSEGSIFKRFPTKQVLFFEAMRTHVAGLSNLEDLAGKGDIQSNMVEMGNEILSNMLELIPRMLVFVFHSGINPVQYMQDDPQAPPFLILKGIERYIKAEINLGRLPERNYEMASRMFFGMLQSYALMETLNSKTIKSPDRKHYVEEVVSMVLLYMNNDSCKNGEIQEKSI